MEPDLRSLRLRGIDEIRTRVPFDAYVWLLTDPHTAVGADPLADVPCLPELARLVRLKYLTEVNRWTTLAAGGSVVRSLGGDPARSLVWREVQSRYGVADVASVVFADRYGCWGFLDLWRGLAFTDREVDLLARLAPDLCEALRQGQAATFAAPALAQPRDLGPVVVLLDDELAVVGQTEAALDWLRALLPRAGSRRSRPVSTTSPPSCSPASKESTMDSRWRGCIWPMDSGSRYGRPGSRRRSALRGPPRWR